MHAISNTTYVEIILVLLLNGVNMSVHALGILSCVYVVCQNSCRSLHLAQYRYPSIVTQ